MYLDVVGIYQSETGITVGEGSGEAIEYAVKMRQFDPNQTLDQIHDRKQLNHDRLEKLCQSVFDFHSSAPISGIEMPFGEPTRSTSPHNLTLIS